LFNLKVVYLVGNHSKIIQILTETFKIKISFKELVRNLAQYSICNVTKYTLYFNMGMKAKQTHDVGSTLDIGWI